MFVDRAVARWRLKVKNKGQWRKNAEIMLAVTLMHMIRFTFIKDQNEQQKFNPVSMAQQR